MSREGEFLIYCIEIYKMEKGISGKETVQLFEKYQVFDYIRSFFEALHTTGDKYIVNDIDLYMRACQAV